MKKKEKIVKLKIKVGDLVEITTGKWKGTIDYISKIKKKEKIVLLKKACVSIYNRRKMKTLTNNINNEKRIRMIPINISCIKKTISNSENN